MFILKQLFLFYLLKTNAYIFHNHLSLKLPYELYSHHKSSSVKDFKIIDKDYATKLSTFWYKELKFQQQYERKNIEMLYDVSQDEYLKMNDIMNFNYNIMMDDKQIMEYVVWKPKIKPLFIKEQKANSIFYPCFRQTLCLIAFKCDKNDIQIENMIYSPFWKGHTDTIDKKSKVALIEYFLDYLKHREIHFNI